MLTGEDMLSQLKLSAPIFEAGLYFNAGSYEKCLPPIKQIVLDACMTAMLQQLYAQLYPNMQFNPLTNNDAKRRTRLQLIIGQTALATSSKSNACHFEFFFKTTK